MALNPLAVNLILDNTFKFLSVDDLKSCRLVCLQWNYEATAILKRAAVPVAFGSKEIMKRFVKSSNKSKNMPVVKINMSSHAFVEENKELLDEFLLTINPFVESLSVSVDTECDFTYRPPKSLDLPKLKELALIGHNLDSKITHGSKGTGKFSEFKSFEKIPHIFQDLLRKSSNLTHLSLLFDPSCKEFVKTIFQLISLHPPRRLTNLELRLPVGDLHLQTLAEIRPKLKQLSCDFPRSCFNKDSLKKFLSSQGNSLEYLVIDNYFGESCYTLEFPVMHNLKTLKVDGRSARSRSDVQFSNFSYTQQFPSLRKLKIGGCVEWNACWRDVFPESQRITTITELKLSRDFVDPLWIRTIGAIFPNLKTLKIWYSAKNHALLPAVFTHMVNLTELTIAFPPWLQDGNVDHALTGVPKTKCKTLAKNLSAKAIITSSESEVITSIKNESNLSNMKTLRRLTLKGMNAENNNDHINANITDVTIAFALVKMVNLEEITLCQSNISDEGLKILQNRLPKCELKLLNCS